MLENEFIESGAETGIDDAAADLLILDEILDELEAEKQVMESASTEAAYSDVQEPSDIPETEKTAETSVSEEDVGFEPEPELSQEDEIPDFSEFIEIEETVPEELSDSYEDELTEDTKEEYDEEGPHHSRDRPQISGEKIEDIFDSEEKKGVSMGFASTWESLFSGKPYGPETSSMEEEDAVSEEIQATSQSSSGAEEYSRTRGLTSEKNVPLGSSGMTTAEPTDSQRSVEEPMV